MESPLFVIDYILFYIETVTLLLESFRVAKWFYIWLLGQWRPLEWQRCASKLRVLIPYSCARRYASASHALFPDHRIFQIAQFEDLKHFWKQKKDNFDYQLVTNEVCCNLFFILKIRKLNKQSTSNKMFTKLVIRDEQRCFY